MDFLFAHFKWNAKSKITVLGLLVLILAANNVVLRQRLEKSEFAQTEIIYNQTTRADLALTRIINEADTYVYFVIYTITNQEIVDALIAAKLRGLEVRGVADYGQSIQDFEKPLISKMRKYGIEIITPFKPEGIIHMKLLVTDKAYASGSFNWTRSAATVNEEILEIGKVRLLHDKYLGVFHSVYKKYRKSRAD